MKRFLTIFCAIAFTGAALSAQNGTEGKSSYMINVGYEKGYRADVELSWSNRSLWGISSSHGVSFGNGLYVGAGAGFSAELTRNTAAAYTPQSNWKGSFITPVFADVKYSFMKTIATPFVSMRGGAIADITNAGVRLFASPAAGVDIARFSIKVGYEYQFGVWGYLDGKNLHNVKLGVAYTF